MRYLITVVIAALSLNAFGQVPNYVPSDGLVAWYPLNGNGDDHGLNNLHGVVNGALPTNSRIGNIDEAMFFDDNSNIDLGTSSLLNPDTALTFGAWFRLDAANSQSGLSTILGRNIDESGNRYCYSFGIETINGFKLRFDLENDNNGSPVLSSNTPVELEIGVWFHYMATFSQASGLMIVYLNGIQVGQLEVGEISVNQLITSTLIGFHRPNGDHSFSGAIDELGVWNRALISYEVMGVTMEQVPLLGCILESACNYDPTAVYDDGSCHFNCQFCQEGTIWNEETFGCVVETPTDSNLDGCTDLNDLMDLLAAYGICVDPEYTCGDLVSHDGYDYSTVQIGDQCWFSENCRYIPSISPSSEGSDTEPYYYVYDYQGTDIEAAKATTNYETYGVLYNWPAVMTEGICPSGWHIPSDGEFTELTDFLGGESVAGGKMKEAGYDHWNSPNTGATNSSGWTGLPVGYRSSGGFNYFGGNGIWWSASESGSYSWGRILFLISDDVGRNLDYRNYGFSARCIKN
jgi:uncharacterized protein (TIGR02145 family)